MADKRILRFEETRAGKDAMLDAAIYGASLVLNVPYEAVVFREVGEVICLMKFASLKLQLERAMDLDEMSRKPKRAA